MLAAGLRPSGGQAPAEAKPDPKPLGEVCFRRVIGRAIECALEASGISKQEASYAMGYANQSSLAKWISGEETPQFAKLWSIPRLRTPLVIALASACDTDVEVRTVVTVMQRRHGVA